MYIRSMSVDMKFYFKKRNWARHWKEHTYQQCYNWQKFNPNWQSTFSRKNCVAGVQLVKPWKIEFLVELKFDILFWDSVSTGWSNIHSYFSKNKFLLRLGLNLKDLKTSTSKFDFMVIRKKKLQCYVQYNCSKTPDVMLSISKNRHYGSILECCIPLVSCSTQILQGYGKYIGHLTQNRSYQQHKQKSPTTQTEVSNNTNRS